MPKRFIFPAIAFALVASFVMAADSGDELLASAQRALEHGDKDQALKLADRAIEADPTHAAAYLVRASVLDARREFNKAIIDFGKAIELSPKSAGAYQRRGEDHFRLGHFKESVSDFDKVIELSPSRAPHHWQRGISLYYAGDFEGGAKQFELHKTVNPEDVENAVWHFLCVARLSGVEKARQTLITIHDDARVPMMQVFALFGGKATPETVLDAANAGNPGAGELKQRLFYAHLYVGLYLEATGEKQAAKEHIFKAAEKYAEEDYMGDVARVHAMVLKSAGGAK